MHNIVCGINPVVRILLTDPNNVEIFYLNSNRKDLRIKEILAQTKLIPQLVDKQFLDKLTNMGHHQGIALQLKNKLSNITYDLEQFLNNNSKSTNLLMLDGVTDAHNMGAIIRSAECMAIDGVIISKNNSAAINQVVLTASAGAAQILPIIIVNNLVNAIERLKKHQFWIVAAMLSDDSISLYQFDIPQKTLWLLGSEGCGIRRLVAENCDYKIKIPLFGQTQSLNVSVAAGIIFSYAKFKQDQKWKMQHN